MLISLNLTEYRLDLHIANAATQHKKETGMDKETYEVPELVDMGSFETLTQGGSASGLLDAAYPIGTPSGSLLFS
ncbi:MAG: lasso RiPP family leader peptide-containing protein [Sphingobium sp.]